MESNLTTTNALLAVIAVLLLLGSPLGPGGCHADVGRYEMVSLPDRPVKGDDPTAVVFDTAEGVFRSVPAEAFHGR